MTGQSIQALYVVVKRANALLDGVDLEIDVTRASIDPDALEQLRACSQSPLPPASRTPLTWDQGSEMATHAGFTTAIGVPVYFCDPHSPWQRGMSENTNGLLRPYFPKYSDLSIYTPQHLADVALGPNNRPGKSSTTKLPQSALLGS